MKKPEKIQPRNLSAQLQYRGRGNSPGSHPSSAVSNSFPGLEMDFRNIWKNIFEGIVLLEYSNLVTGVDENVDKKIKALISEGPVYELITADEKKMTAPLTGPAHRHNHGLSGEVALEWSNALAEILPKAGQVVRCKFQNNTNRRKYITVDLKVRHFFDVDLNRNGKITSQRVVISRAMAGPGDLTQSLCSPWQNDYRECGCFYWAASRPDYVNVEPGPKGKSRGNNWMEKDRKPGAEANYIVDNFADTRLVTYDELFTGWEQALRFIIAGKDEPPLKPSKK